MALSRVPYNLLSETHAQLKAISALTGETMSDILSRLVAAEYAKVTKAKENIR